jgi:hypothetical protein
MNRTVVALACLFSGLASASFAEELKEIVDEPWSLATELGASLVAPFDSQHKTVVDGSATAEAAYAVPLFRWAEGPLFDGNRLRAQASATTGSDVLTVSGRVDLELIDCAKLRFGADLGSGWTVHAGGTSLYGLALNPANDADPLVPLNFKGVYDAWASIPLKLSLAYFMPDPLANLLSVEFEPKVEYRALDGAGPGQAWVWNNDEGRNFNGTRIRGTVTALGATPYIWGLKQLSLVLAYDSPVLELLKSSPASAGGWGSDIGTGSLGLLCRVGLSPWDILVSRLGIYQTLLWSSDTVSHRYFGNRSYAGAALGLSFSFTYRYEY